MNTTNQFVLNVKQLNLYVKSLLESDRNLRSVTVRGEISNFVRHSKSGHLYFTLKDADSAVKTVMFYTAAQKLQFVPKDGTTVLVKGRISLYERDGQYQLYADHMAPDGLGAGYLAFLALKDRLEKEGLFDPLHKKALPAYPKVIGLATSPTGAAVQDVTGILSRRYPQGGVLFYPCVVQGTQAVPSLIEAIRYFNRDGRADVIIMTRGGGSYEDLSAFNDEGLARTVFASRIPVVSAVGHDIDFTILDFVADARAATPSAAAEIVSPDMEKTREQFQTLRSLVFSAMNAKIGGEQVKLAALHPRLDICRRVESLEQQSDSLYTRVFSGISRSREREQSRLQLCLEKINALSPLRVLERGYSLAYHDGNLLKSVTEVGVGDKILLKLKDGELDCAAAEIKKRNEL